MTQKNGASHDQSDHVRLYMRVFGALMVLTVVTVFLSYAHLSPGVGIPLGIAVALVKASLVAAIFMHLKWEKPLIYGLLGLTFFLALGLIVTFVDTLGYRGRLVHHEAPAEAEGHHAPAAAHH